MRSFLNAEEMKELLELETETKYDEGSVEMHNVFVSLLKAGFTEYQACVMLGNMIAAIANKGGK